MSWSKYFCGMAFVAIAKCTQEKCPRLNSVSVGCLSKICFLYCRWKAEFSSELPIKLPLHQVGSSNNILNKICHGNGLGFPSQAEATRSCSFCLSHLLSLYPPHQQAPFLPWPFPLSFFFFSFFHPLSVILFILSSHSLTSHFSESFPSGKLWTRPWKLLQNHHWCLRTNTVCLLLSSAGGNSKAKW